MANTDRRCRFSPKTAMARSCSLTFQILTRPIFLSSFLLLFPTLPLTQGQTQRPHMVLILADDLGWSDVGFHDESMVTPNIDQLAAEGVVLDSSYMMKSCTPSRSSMLTGTYAYRMGLEHSSLTASMNYSLPLDKKLFPEYLQENGYSSHYVGKWHLGFCKPAMTPTYRGFETFYGMYNGEGDYNTHLSKKKGYDMQDNKGRDYPNNFEADWSAKGTYSTELFTNKAVEVIQNHDPSTPLFLVLSYQAVHAPLQAPEKYLTETCAHVTSEVPQRKLHCAVTAAMDEGIGQVVAALKDKGLSENLLLLFTADNGGPITEGSSNWPLRGGKITEWEGGTRVVSILNSKKLLPNAPYTWNGLMHAVDWYKTLLSAAGIQPDTSGTQFDGVDNWSSIVQNAKSQRTEFVYNINRAKENYSLRWMQYKLVSFKRPNPNGWFNPPPPGKTEEAPSGALPEYMLFDIEKDPEERTDLGSNPDYKETLDQMKDKLSGYMADLPPLVEREGEKYAKPVDGAWTTGWC